MDSRKLVLTETAIAAIGEAIGVALMIGVFALLGAYDRAVLLGGIMGGVMAIANFFFMAMSLMIAADKAQKQDVKGGQATMHTSYIVRLAVLFLVLFACAKSGYFNAIALVVPLLFPRLTLTIVEFFRKTGDSSV